MVRDRLKIEEPMGKSSAVNLKTGKEGIYMDEALEKYLRGFFKRYGINTNVIDLDSVNDFDTMMKELCNSGIDFDVDRFPYDEFLINLQIIFGFHENGMDLDDIDDYESKYSMGNPYKFGEGECTKEDLAREILTKLKPNPKIAPDDIDASIPEFIIRIYRKGGLVHKLEEDLRLDLNQFTEESYEIEKCKIIYFFYALIHKHLPILQNKKQDEKQDEKWDEKGKKSNVLKFLRNLSLENSDFVPFGYQPKNAKIVQFIKISLEKELHIKKIAYIRDALEHVETAWHDYLDAVVFTIDNDKNIDFNLEFRLFEAMLHKSHNAIEGNISELSPIETLYLKFLQFERLGELEDVTTINDIPPDANKSVHPEFTDRMKLWANTPILVDSVRNFIEDKNKTAEIAQLVYLEMETTEDEQKNIRQCSEQVIRMLEYCACVKPSLIYNKEIPKLRIVSCLQAILIDNKKKTDYKFYDFEKSLSTHPPKIEDMPENDEDTINIQVRYWVRRMIDNWYANIGRYDLSCKLRELENKCCEILTEIYSCSSVSDMLSVHNDYYGNRYEIFDSIFK